MSSRLSGAFVEVAEAIPITWLSALMPRAKAVAAAAESVTMSLAEYVETKAAEG